VPESALIQASAGTGRQPAIHGLLVPGARGHAVALGPSHELQLAFALAVEQPWAVLRAELRGAHVFVSASNLPDDPARFVCVSESSAGQKLSQITFVNSTLVTCEIQAVSGLVTFELRDLTTGLSSRSFSLDASLKPTLVGVSPSEVFLADPGPSALPLLRVAGLSFAKDCTCELEGERLPTRFVSPAELECALTSSLALTALERSSTRPKSWSLAVRCASSGWLSQGLAVWPRRGPELLAASRQEVTEQAFLDGSKHLVLTGRDLTEGLHCVQRAKGAPGKEHAYPLILKGPQSALANCEVAFPLFETAPSDALVVELFLRGEHVVPSILELSYFPRPVLSLSRESPSYFFKETSGQLAVLSTSIPLPQESTRILACHFQPRHGAEHAGPGVLNASYSTGPVHIEPHFFSCPLPVVWDDVLDHLLLYISVSGKTRQPSLPSALSSRVRLELRMAPRIQYVTP